MSMNNKNHIHSGHRTEDHALTSHVPTPVKTTALHAETLSFWFNKYGFLTIKRPWKTTS